MGDRCPSPPLVTMCVHSTPPIRRWSSIAYLLDVGWNPVACENSAPDGVVGGLALTEFERLPASGGNVDEVETEADSEGGQQSAPDS